MILIQLYHLEKETSEELTKNRERVLSGEITEEERKELAKQIISWYKIETDKILNT